MRRGNGGRWWSSIKASVLNGSGAPGREMGGRGRGRGDAWLYGMPEGVGVAHTVAAAGRNQAVAMAVSVGGRRQPGGLTWAERPNSWADLAQRETKKTGWASWPTRKVWAEKNGRVTGPRKRKSGKK
jgi:hypothetical protein